MNESDFKKDTTFGVIGVCGANGNLIARLLKDRGFNVIGTDISQKRDCRFANALEDYDIDVFYGRTPDAFFNRSDYIIPPASLSKDSEMYKRINKPILELNDIIDIFKADKPVFGITGTNGKTTTTTLLKKVAKDNGINPCEHKLAGECRIHSYFAVKTEWGRWNFRGRYFRSSRNHWKNSRKYRNVCRHNHKHHPRSPQ